MISDLEKAAYIRNEALILFLVAIEDMRRYRNAKHTNDNKVS